ncbi:MAG TPA: response regulator [Flavitalea sp.]|nr:response regulator [Flavitalea sp.]
MDIATKNLVYIVDDDPDDRQIILDAFLENNAEMDYVFAEDGNQLLQHLEDTDGSSDLPTLILLDLNMPGMLGLQALKEIKGNKEFSSIPTIVLTTSTLPMDKKLSYEYGANCFLSKPPVYSELVAITKMIARLYFRQWK